MFELYRGYEIHPAQIPPRDRFFIIAKGSATPEHDAPHFVSAAAARSAIDAGPPFYIPRPGHATDRLPPPRCIAPMSDDVDPRLCGAPATAERDVEGLTCAMCAKHAAEMDAERGEKEPPSIK